MLNRLTIIGIGLTITASLSAEGSASEGSMSAAQQASPAIAIERSDGEGLQVSGTVNAPAWQEPGFVMGEVVATSAPMPLELPEPTPMSPDLEALLELHKAARNLRF